MCRTKRARSASRVAYIVDSLYSARSETAVFHVKKEMREEEKKETRTKTTRLTNPCRRRGSGEEKAVARRSTGPPPDSLLFCICCFLLFLSSRRLVLVFLLPAASFWPYHPLRKSAFLLKQVRTAQGDGSRIGVAYYSNSSVVETGVSLVCYFFLVRRHCRDAMGMQEIVFWFFGRKNWLARKVRRGKGNTKENAEKRRSLRD